MPGSSSSLTDLGPTGEMGDDPLPGSDGEIRFAVCVHQGRVIMDFGDCAVKWIGLDADEADQLTAALAECAKAVKA